MYDFVISPTMQECSSCSTSTSFWLSFDTLVMQEIYLIKVFEFKIAYYLISFLKNVGYKGTTLSFQTSLEMCFFWLFPEQSDQSFTDLISLFKKPSFRFHWFTLLFFLFFDFDFYCYAFLLSVYFGFLLPSSSFLR